MEISQPPPQGETVDGSDYRDGEGLDASENIISFFAEGLSLRLGKIAHLADIRAGYKGLLSGSGKNQGPDLLQIHSVQGRVQIVQYLAVQSVQSLGRLMVMMPTAPSVS